MKNQQLSLKKAGVLIFFPKQQEIKKC